MKKNVILILAMFSMAAYIVLTGFTNQATEKIGYIETQRLFTEYSEFVEATTKLEGERKPYEDEFQKMQDAFATGRDEYESKQMLYSEERRQQAIQELNDLGQQIQTYGGQHFGQDGTLARMTMEVTNPILEKVRAKIKVIGENLDYDYVVDGNAEVVLYAKESKNITDLVIKELEKDRQ